VPLVSIWLKGDERMGKIALAIHGGCGVMAETGLTAQEWAEARQDLAQALKAGWLILADGGRALDAVEAAVVVLEDSVHFNAGYGAALNRAGNHELDASIMDGATLAAGAVAAVRRIRNPVRAARAVLDKGDAVLLVGPAADGFARDAGLDIVPPTHFTTDRRVSSLARMKAHEANGTAASASEAEKHGTVGAVALDARGHLAAATSTGGYNNKPEGRVGDSPIIGAGTFARNGVCAVSGTGKGELFMRYVLAHEVASRVRHLGESLAQAADAVIEELAPYGAGAGLVAVGADGSVAAPFNTDGMFRGWVTEDGVLHVATHREVFTVTA
jgi:beta-aspartyl-peptidase (threonine type)